MTLKFEWGITDGVDTQLVRNDGVDHDWFRSDGVDHD